METIIDTELGGHAMKFQSPLEIVEVAVAANKQRRHTSFNYLYSGEDFLGIKCNNWDHVLTRFNSPWTEGVRKCEDMLEEIRRELPIPKSRNRKRRFSDSNGEVEIDRAIRGEVEFMEDCRRELTHGTYNIALLCNLDAEATTSAQDVFWRGAGAVAAIDVLEAHGYLVECHMWCRGYNVFPKYPDGTSEQFTTCPLKQCGDVLDIDSLLRSLSAWFLRAGVFGSFLGAPTYPVGLGGPDHELGPWIEHIDVTEGMHVIEVPVSLTREGAISNSIKILEDLKKAQEEL